jgi:hypothetical protein
MGLKSGKKGKKSLLLLFNPIVMDKGEEFVEIDIASRVEATF